MLDILFPAKLSIPYLLVVGVANSLISFGVWLSLMNLSWSIVNTGNWIGKDWNPPKLQHDTARKDWEWETVVKMTMIARDLMIGNPRLAELGFGEEALGHNAIAGGFQGQRHWTDHFPNGDFMEAMLTSSFGKWSVQCRC